MDDKSLYRQILGLEKPWMVENVDLDLSREEVKVYIKYDSEKGICPICNAECAIYDYPKARTWRHLDTCQMKTYLIGNLPRVKCLEHNVLSIKTSWSEANSHFTSLFENLAITILQATQNQTKASALLRISFDQIHLIMEKAVFRGLERRKELDIEYIGIDEKSMKRGHTYMTVVSDLKTGTILDVAENRTKESAKELLKSLKSKNNFNYLKAVSMDMWKAYMSAVSEVFPNVAIVHDKFHIMKYLNDAVDKTRLSESKVLNKNKDNSLKKSKFLFLKNRENMTCKQAIRFTEIKKLNLKTCKAWLIKENFKEFFKCNYINEAKSYFSHWFDDVKQSNLPKMIKVGKMLLNHSPGLLNYITHRISSAISENLNGQIQKIKTVARGFYNIKNYKNAILFYLGKLDMSPLKNQ